MSADTYLYVDKNKFEVWRCIASCLCPHKSHRYNEQKQELLGKGKDLREAIEIADKADDHNNEYGISFTLWCKV